MKNPRDEKRALQLDAEAKRMSEKTEKEGSVSAPLLNVGEAAKYLGVGRKVLYQLIERGEITVVKAGRATLVEKKSLDDFRARGTLT
jgi:excisionase family DNA binding protein